MENHIVKRRVKRALHCPYHNDAFLLEKRASEWSISHKFAEYLQQEFPSYHVDCEYNREGWEELPKTLSNLPECSGDLEESPESQERRILPDVLVHERGYNDRNLLAIEMKLSGPRDADCDKAKLRELTSDDNAFEYENGLFIDLPVGSEFRYDETTCIWFGNGDAEDVVTIILRE